jgi:hypothetical protein
MRRTVIALTFAVSTLTATPSGFFHPLWSFLSSIWGEPSDTAGPGVDPDGRHLTAPRPNTKEGPGMDPWGRTLTAPQPSADAGPGWDPWGAH